MQVSDELQYQPLSRGKYGEGVSSGTSILDERKKFESNRNWGCNKLFGTYTFRMFDSFPDCTATKLYTSSSDNKFSQRECRQLQTQHRLAPSVAFSFYCELTFTSTS